METFRRIRDVILHPDTSFKSIQKEKGIRNGFRFLTYLILFVLLFLTYTYLRQINSYLEIVNLAGGRQLSIAITPQSYVIAYLGFAVLFILLSFFRYWVIHWFVLLFGGSYPYKETYKAMVYSRAPEYISAPLLLGIVLLMTFVRGPFALLGILVLGLPFLAISIYQMVLRTKALAKLQHISYLKSFLAIYVLGMITLLLIVGTVEFVLLGIGVFLLM